MTASAFYSHFLYRPTSHRHYDRYVTATPALLLSPNRHPLLRSHRTNRARKREARLSRFPQPPPSPAKSLAPSPPWRADPGPSAPHQSSSAAPPSPSSPNLRLHTAPGPCLRRRLKLSVPRVRAPAAPHKTSTLVPGLQLRPPDCSAPPHPRPASGQCKKVSYSDLLHGVYFVFRFLACMCGGV